jgi:hypothetical protein
MIGQANVTRSEAIDLCEYIHWADLHEISLNITASHDDVHNCHGLLKSVDKYVNYVDEKLGNIASNQFKQYLHDHILSVAKELDYNLTMHYIKNSQKSLEASRTSERHRNNVET